MKLSALFSSRRLIIVVITVVAALVLVLQSIISPAHKSQAAPLSADSPQSAVRQATPVAMADSQVQMLPAQPDAALDAPPKEADAVVGDAKNPNWITRYGTQAGRMLLAPRPPDQSFTPAGAVPPLSGFWLTTTIQSGTQGVRAEAYAPDGRLFAALYGLGLRVYGPNGSGVYGWTTITATLGHLLSNNVTALAIFQNKLWIGTGGSGVNTYDLSSGAWLSYTVANSPLPNNTINRFTPVIDPNGPDYIWISTYGGAAKLILGHSNTWNIINTADGLPSNIIYDVAVDPTDFPGTTTTTWFATDSGLRSTINLTTFTTQTGGGSCTGWDYATRIIVDRQHRVWFTPIVNVPGLAPNGHGPSTVSHDPIGVCLRVWHFLSPTSWTLYNSISPGLPDDYVTDLSEDFAGRIWMSMSGYGAATGGGAVYDNGTWRLYTKPTSPLLDNSLWTVLAVGEDVWWGHTALNAFTIYSPNWLRYSSAQIGNAPSALFLEATRTWAGANDKIAYITSTTWLTLALPGNASAVTSFARDGSGNLWVGTFSNGVYELNSSNVVTDHFTLASGLLNNSIHALYADSLGRIWVGTNSGIALYTEAGYWLNFNSTNSPLVSDLVTSLSQDNNQRLWIGTRNNGISVYDLNAMGSSAWTTQTLATGIPSTTINAVVRDPVGTLWVATAGGVGAWNPISQTWKIYSTTNGALPNNNATSIASDPTGHIWVTTMGGVSTFDGSAWKFFHVPDTAIENNKPFAVAADNDRTWIAATNSIAVRGIITSPIGSSVPTITMFSPTAASPGYTVVITGFYFDDRDPQFNIVKFPNEFGFPTIPADVYSATTTRLEVSVPAASSSGKLQVEANGLKSGLSAATFQLKPTISDLNSTCLSVGDELDINGSGFMDGSAAAYVKIGSGPERIADATDPTQIRTFIRATDTSGPVRVRLLNGQIASNQPSVQLATLLLDQTGVQQGIDTEQMIWGKRTLVMIWLASERLRAGHDRFGAAELEDVHRAGQRLHRRRLSYLSEWQILPLLQQPHSVQNAVSILADLDIAFLADDLNLPSSHSSLQFFKGVTVTLSNHFIPVMTVVLPANKFNYIDTAGARRHFTMMMVTGQDADHQSSDFDSVMMDNLIHVARLYPQQDADWFSLQYSWLHETPIWIDTPPINFAASGGNSDLAVDPVDDYLDPGGQYWAVALVDASNFITTSGYTGIGGIPARTVTDANQKNRGGTGVAHELMHAFGFVDGGAANYKSSNTPGEDHHSKYDENQWARAITVTLNYTQAFNTKCTTSQTFAQALKDELGADKLVVRLYGNGAPVPLRTAACNSSALNDQFNTAKSVIAYAPSRNNFNSMLEPLDYQTLLDQICDPASKCPGYKGTPLNSPMVMAQPNAPSTVTRTLHLSGKIDLSNNVTTSLSYVAVNEGEVTPQQPLGDYHLIVRNASNTILHDQVFEMAFEDTAPHPPDGNLSDSLPLHPTHGGISVTVDLFNLRVPFPVGAVEAEIQHDGTVIYSNTVSANTPTVNFVAPTGGTHNAASTLPITWTASDLDSDPLQFGLDYSADNGANWTMIAPKLLGDHFDWNPNFITASTTARLRLRASDGFNVGVAESNLFTLTARAPEAIILAPEEDAIYTEGSLLTLNGLSFTSEGMNLGMFTWKRNATTIGTTRTVTTSLNAIGLITYTLTVAKDSQHGTRVVSITVVPDYDHDSLPNSWELQYKLNPLDAGDALSDPDGDGLTNLDEYQNSTNPKKADTDGDGYSDGAEVAAGTDPLNPASHPIATPILNVGANELGFTVNTVVQTLDPKSTWVTNGGGGSINWSLSKDAWWLNVTPVTGTAPQQLTIGAIPIALITGTYVGHITVTAPSVTGSPQVITVTLDIDTPVPSHPVYLPIVLK